MDQRNTEANSDALAKCRRDIGHESTFCGLT